MSPLRSVSLALLTGVLASCSGHDVLNVPIQKAYVIGSTIYVNSSEAWVNLNNLLGKDLDKVEIRQNPDGALDIREQPYDVWSVRCYKTATGKIRVEVKFTLPSEDYWVECKHDQGSGG